MLLRHAIRWSGCAVWLCLAFASPLAAHPGSGIAVSDEGVVYFTDTGRGLWRIAPGGEPELISQNSNHWLALDRTGAFADSPAAFGRWFERATPEGAIPAVIECTDFPMTIARDGNIYYVDTIRFPSKVKRRTPEGQETIIAEIVEEPPTAEEGGPSRYVTSITQAPDGFLYAVEAAAQDEYVVIRKIGMNGNVSIVARSFVPTNIAFEPRPSIAPSAVPPGMAVPMSSRSYCRGLAVDEDGTIYVAATSVRAVLAIPPGGKARVVIQAESPYAPTDIDLHKGEIYVLEYDHTGEDRLYWFPRVRKISGAGEVTTLATINPE